MMQRRSNRETKQSWRLLAVLAGLWSAAPLPLAAATEPPLRWAVGAQFEQRLASVTGVQWVGTPLRPALQRLAEAQQVAILIDRRLDPDQPVDFSGENMSLEQLLQSLADSRGWGLSRIGPVVYLGPAPTTLELATYQALQEAALRRLPAAVQRRWRQPRDASWPELTEPRQLVAKWLADVAIEVRGLDQIPYDLWAAQSLPQLELLERLTLTLAGFGLGAEIQSSGVVHVVPLPGNSTIQARYPIPRHLRARLPELEQLASDCETELQGQTLDVRGRIEAHRRIQAWLQPPRSQSVPPRPGEKRYTLTVKNQPLESILRAVAARESRAPLGTRHRLAPDDAGEPLDRE